MTEDAKQKNQPDDDLEIETDGEEDEFELEVVDDTPEADRGRPRRAEGAEPDIPDDDELENYSDGVKKRIAKLRYEFHEERRAKEEESRISAEAVKQAQRYKEEAERYRKIVDEGTSTLYEQTGGRIEAEIAAARSAWRSAYEEGDPDKIMEADEKLARLQGEKLQLDHYKRQTARDREQPTQPNQPSQPQRPQVRRPSDRANEWHKRNPWYWKDEELTGYAMGVHNMIVNAGVQPDSEEYYRQIDERVRKRFPDKFEGAGETERRGTGPVVAPAQRSEKKPRKVKLTQTQVSLAKRLGLTNKQYAEQLLKEQQRNG